MSEPSEGCPYRMLRSSFPYLITMSSIRDQQSDVDSLYEGIPGLFQDIQASRIGGAYDFSEYGAGGRRCEVHPLLRRIMPLLHEHGRRHISRGNRSRGLADFFDRLHVLGYAVPDAPGVARASFAGLAGSVRPRSNVDTSNYGQWGSVTTSSTASTISWGNAMNFVVNGISSSGTGGTTGEGG